LLSDRRRFLGNVFGGRFRGNVAAALIERLPCAFERLHDDGANLWLEAPAQNHSAVFILIHVEGPACVARSPLLHLGVAVDIAPPAHDTLNVLRRAGLAHFEQPLFGLGRGDARKSTDF